MTVNEPSTRTACGGRRKGSMLLECGLALPMVFVLVLAVVQFAQIWTARHVLAYAAYCAARATLSARPLQQMERARAAAEDVCSWVNPSGLPGAADDARVEVPGWGEIPGSDSIAERIDVEFDAASFAADVAGRSTGVSCVSVTYRYPLVIPVVGRLIVLLTGRTDGAERATDDGSPFLALKETCVLPLPYSTAELPSQSSPARAGDGEAGK